MSISVLLVSLRPYFPILLVTYLQILRKMRTKQNIIAILAVALVSACVCGCTYNELPPKTSDASKSYIKPKGEIPTAEEREAVKAIKAEYEAATSGKSKE